MIKYNLNYPVYFKLTDAGREVLEKYYHELYKHIGHDEAAIEQNTKKAIEIFLSHNKEIGGETYYETQLWEFAQVFGPAIFCGCQVPVETDIYLEEQ